MQIRRLTAKKTPSQRKLNLVWGADNLLHVSPYYILAHDYRRYSRLPLPTNPASGVGIKKSARYLDNEPSPIS